ncbi:MAG: dihydrolipoyl dehydrogenase [Verrucomicrobia bacterium GWC2_42_7]|nr:MAG: dihydrolipoyl dehydrogenase [Verrucomicrobia bacterium GWC2_42_7]
MIYDLVVIGGGPAGYAAAIRAAQLGKRVACVEKERVGGTCLNWGCIPTKALIKSAGFFSEIKNSATYGVLCDNPRIDFSKIMERSRRVVDTMARGIEFLFKKNKIDYFIGVGQVVANERVDIIDGRDKGTSLTTSKVLIATGCKARELSDLPVDGARVLTSREALDLKTLPKSILVLGAGAIGVEFAYAFNALGTKVTLIEKMSQIMPQEDAEVSAAAARSLQRQGICILTNATLENIQILPGGIRGEVVQEGKRTSLENDHLLVAIGVVPQLEGLLPAHISLELDRGFIKVNERYETSIPNIYAAGDIIGPPWLAHVATFEAIQAIDCIYNQETPRKLINVPCCTYCQPQIGSVGITEQQAKTLGIKYKIGKFPFLASGKAVVEDKAEGFVKLVVDSENNKILGVHIIGSDATEMIAEYVLAMDLGATPESVLQSIHAHPTLSEANAESAAVVLGKAINL